MVRHSVASSAGWDFTFRVGGVKMQHACAAGAALHVQLKIRTALQLPKQCICAFCCGTATARAHSELGLSHSLLSLLVEPLASFHADACGSGQFKLTITLAGNTW